MCDKYIEVKTRNIIQLIRKLQVAENELAFRTNQRRIFDAHAKLSNKLL